MIAFRTTCGAGIGLGHLRRCLTLAAELPPPVAFWLAGDASGPALAAEAGFRAQLLDGTTPREPDATLAALASSGAEVIVVDDYALDAHALAALRRRARVVVIDDLADRMLDADLVVNGNAYAESLPYRTAEGAGRLLGPRFALLRRTFREMPRRRAGAQVERVLITMGGADPRGQTALAVAAARACLPEAAIDVVIGPLFAPTPALDAPAPRVTFHRAPADLAPLLARADLAITAAGQTTYELAAAGVPAVALCQAENQRPNLAALARVPTLHATDEAKLSHAVRALAGDRALRQKMADAGQALVDGLGAERVAQAIVALTAKVGEARHA